MPGQLLWFNTTKQGQLLSRSLWLACRRVMGNGIQFVYARSSYLSEYSAKPDISMPRQLLWFYSAIKDKFLPRSLWVSCIRRMGNGIQFLHTRSSYLFCRNDYKGSILSAEFQRNHNGNKHRNMCRSIWRAAMEWIHSNNQYMYARSGNMFSINAG